MNRLKSLSVLLSAVIFTGVLPLTARAIPVIDQINDAISWMGWGSEPDNSYCDGYAEYQRKIQNICYRYSEEQTQKVTTIPAASKLKEKTLYLVSTGNNTIVTPMMFRKVPASSRSLVSIWHWYPRELVPMMIVAYVS